MKTTVFAILLAGIFAVPSLAGLKFVAVPNKTTAYLPGEAGTITLQLQVDPNSFIPSNDVILVGGAGSTPAVFSFTGTGTLPTFSGPAQPVSPFINSLLGFPNTWQTPNSVNPPGPAQPITVQPGNPVAVATFDFIMGMGSVFNFEVNGLQSSDANGATSAVFSGILEGGSITAVPEPSSFLFLGLVGSGVLGVRMVRRRKLAADVGDQDTEVSEEPTV